MTLYDEHKIVKTAPRMSFCKKKTLLMEDNNMPNRASKILLPTCKFLKYYYNILFCSTLIILWRNLVLTLVYFKTM